MKQRALGTSGLLVSAIGLGTSNFNRTLDAKGAAEVVHRAIDLGITFFDSAAAYSDGGAEDALGQALVSRRHNVIIATKWGQQPWGSAEGVPYRGASRHEIMKSAEASLRRLRTDYIDLFQLHKPDLLTPVEETLRALDDLVRQGKVRYLGVSNLPSWRVAEMQLGAAHLGLNRLITCQDEYSLLVRRQVETETVPMMQSLGLGLLPYTALASGLLTGKYRRNQDFPEGSRFAAPAWGRAVEDVNRFTDPKSWDIVEGLSAFAEARGHRLLELAFAWLLGKPYIGAVIAGAMSPAQVESNAVCAEWVLSPAEMAEVDAISQGTA